MKFYFPLGLFLAALAIASPAPDTDAMAATDAELDNRCRRGYEDCLRRCDRDRDRDHGRDRDENHRRCRRRCEREYCNNH